MIIMFKLKLGMPAAQWVHGVLQRVQDGLLGAASALSEFLIQQDYNGKKPNSPRLQIWLFHWKDGVILDNFASDHSSNGHTNGP